MTDMELAEEIERILVEYHRAVELDDASLLPKIMSRWCDLFFKPGASAIIAALRRGHEPEVALVNILAIARSKSKILDQFLRQGFWHAHHVDLVWRKDGEDIREEADWLKDLWYLLRDNQPTAEGRKPCPLCGRTDPHSHISGPLGIS